MRNIIVTSLISAAMLMTASGCVGPLGSSSTATPTYTLTPVPTSTPIPTPTPDVTAMYKADLAGLLGGLAEEVDRLNSLFKATDNSTGGAAYKARTAGEAVATMKNASGAVEKLRPPPCAVDYQRKLVAAAFLFDTATSELGYALRIVDPSRMGEANEAWGDAARKLFALLTDGPTDCKSGGA